MNSLPLSPALNAIRRQLFITEIQMLLLHHLEYLSRQLIMFHKHFLEGMVINCHCLSEVAKKSSDPKKYSLQGKDFHVSSR